MSRTRTHITHRDRQHAMARAMLRAMVSMPDMPDRLLRKIVQADFDRHNRLQH